MDEFHHLLLRIMWVIGIELMMDQEIVQVTLNPLLIILSEGTNKFQSVQVRE